MRSENKTKLILNITVGLALLIQTLLVLYMEYRFAFMLEDIDYLENLAAGGALKNIGQFFSEIPAILTGNGGSVFSIFVLQATLLAGKYAADIINLVALLIISFLIFRVAGARKKDLVYFAIPFFMLFALNNDWQFSYMWQFGIVNYVYPAIPFLVYVLFVSKELDSNNKIMTPVHKCVACLSAFIASWMSASYGIVCLGIFLVSVFLIVKIIKKKIPSWLIVSMGFMYLGMALFLLCPGNLGENAIVRGTYITFSIFPGVVLALLLLAVMLRCDGWLSLSQMMLVTALGIAVATRFVIGWIPIVYENGIQICTLVLSITLFVSLLRNFNKEHPKQYYWTYAIALCAFIYSLALLLEDVGGVN